MVFPPEADAFVADIRMRGIENVFSETVLLKKSMGTWILVLLSGQFVP
jgi:hypothetical protein